MTSVSRNHVYRCNENPNTPRETSFSLCGASCDMFSVLTHSAAQSGYWGGRAEVGGQPGRRYNH